MNKFLMLVVLASFTGYSQQLSYGTGGNVFDGNDKKLKPAEVRTLLKNNEEALSSYNSGRTKKTWGNVLFYGGLGLATVNLVSALTMETTEVDDDGNIRSRRATPTLAIIGGGMFVASIPIKIGYTRKIRTAIDSYNKNLVSIERIEPEISVLANNQGVGVRITF